MNPNATRTAKTLATYAADSLRQWAVEFADGIIEAMWASSKSQAITLASEKRLALTGRYTKVSHVFRM